MSQKTVANALHAVMEKISNAPYHGRILRDMLPYELLPIIRNSPALNDEYERRVHYYEHLATSSTYKSLRDNIIATVWEIHPHIDRASLESPVTFWLPTKGSWSLKQIGKHLSVQQFYDALPTPEWCDMGDTLGSNIETPDSQLCPWEAVLEQFQEVVKLVGVAEVLSGFADAGASSAQQLRKLVGKLATLFQEPWHSLHIGDFEDLHCYIIKRSSQDGYEENVSKFLDDEDTPEDFAKAQASAMVVCRDLLVCLEKPRGKKMRYENKTFFEAKRELRLPKNASYALLCDVFYPKCPNTGSLRWQEVARLIMEANREWMPRPNKLNREQIRLWMKSLNRWARSKKRFNEDIMELQGDYLVRLR